MTWLQLRLDTNPDAASALEDQVLAAGAVAVTLEDNADQPVLEPGVGEHPLWQQTRLTGLFPADTDMDRVLAALDAGLLAAANQRVEILEDKDWEREWMNHYRPMQFGERLWVCPSWMDPPEPDAINLLLDPGLAFGTGTHPTTAMCLTALSRLSMAGRPVVDYGCGSGILAVAAAKLQAAPVLAVDNDPQALVATRDNARRNQVPDDGIAVALPDGYDIETWRSRAAVVVANILAGPLKSLRDTLCDLLAPGGTLLLAGLLEDQADELIEHYAGRLTLQRENSLEGWTLLAGNVNR